MSAALSYVHGAAELPLLGETIGVAFDNTVARYGECHALTVRQQGVRWTYRELAERVDALRRRRCWRSASSRATGSAIWAPNCAEWVVAQFATAKAGLILVNINPAYRLAELEYALNKVGCRALITATAFKTSDYIGMLGSAGAGAGRRRARAGSTRRSCRRCAS